MLDYCKNEAPSRLYSDIKTWHASASFNISTFLQTNMKYTHEVKLALYKHCPTPPCSRCLDTVQAIYPASMLNSYLYSRNLIHQLSSIKQLLFFSLPAIDLTEPQEKQSCSSHVVKCRRELQVLLCLLQKSLMRF